MVSRVDEKPARVLDEWFSPLATDPQGATAFLAEVADRVARRGFGRRVLELDFHSGPVAHALSANGFGVSTANPVSVADGRDSGLSAGDRFDVAFVVHDVLSRLPVQRDQVRLLRRTAALLRPGGALVVQGFVPDLARWDEDIWVTEHERAAQRLRLTRGRTGPPLQLRYVWPAELDLMGELAGLALEGRWGGWYGEPVAHSAAHVSVFRS